MHELLVTNEGEAVRGAPHFLRSMPQSKKDYDGETYSFFLLILTQHFIYKITQSSYVNPKAVEFGRILRYCYHSNHKFNRYATSVTSYLHEVKFE